jgi:hypothetical protein
MIMVLGFATMTLAAQSPAVSRPAEIEPIYAVGDDDPANVGQQMAFSKVKRKFVIYQAKEVGRPYWGSEAGGLYEEVVRNGIRFDLGTEFSVPIDIEVRRDWTVNAWTCTSVRAAGLWKIYCQILDPTSNRTRKFMAYEYTKERGVTGLTMTSRGGNLCWYSLVTSSGILRPGASDAKKVG